MFGTADFNDLYCISRAVLALVNIKDSVALYKIS